MAIHKNSVLSKMAMTSSLTAVIRSALLGSSANISGSAQRTGCPGLNKSAAAAATIATVTTNTNNDISREAYSWVVTSVIPNKFAARMGRPASQ